MDELLQRDSSLLQKVCLNNAYVEEEIAVECIITADVLEKHKLVNTEKILIPCHSALNPTLQS
jgi:hypothetical protein